MANDRDDQRKARELLAAEYDRDGIPFVADCIRTDAMLSRVEDRAIRAVVAALAQRHIEQCCTCGKRFDAREQSEGGGPEGAQLTDGRWTCSADCWELATAQRAPQNGAVSEGWQLVPCEPDAAMDDAAEMALCGSIGGYEFGCWRMAWNAALAAAPAPDHSAEAAGTARHHEEVMSSDPGRPAEDDAVDRGEVVEPSPRCTTAPEAERAKGEAVAEIIAADGGLNGKMLNWKRGLVSFIRDASIGTKLYTHPAPPPAGQPDSVEVLADSIAHTFDRDDDGKGWVFDSAQLAEFARRLASAQQENDHA